MYIGLPSLGLRQSSSGLDAAIRALFAAGEQGGWYDPSDISTMWQDSTGTTAAAIEQPVGLILDKRAGLSLGANTGPASTFTGGEWTLGSGFTIAASKLVITAATAGAGAQRSSGTIYTIAGGTQYLSVTVDSISGGTLNIAVGNTFFAVAAPGTYTARLSPTASNYLGVIAATGTVTGAISNITVQSLAGNHLIQATSASRPTLSARYNKLTKSETLTDAAWVKNSSSLVAGTLDPSGGTSAFTLTADGTSNIHYLGQTNVSMAAASKALWYVKAGTATICQLLWTGSPTGYVNFDLTNGVLGSTGGDASGGAITSIGNGWYVISANTSAVGATGSAVAFISSLSDVRAPTITSSNTLTLWKSDWRTSADAALSIPAYQRVDTATSYDTSGFPMYLNFDGVDDGLASAATMDLTSTSKLTVWTGITKGSDNASMILETSANAPGFPGCWYIDAPESTTNPGFLITGAGPAPSGWTSAMPAAPASRVFTMAADFAGANSSVNIKPYLNGVLTQTATLGSAGALVGPFSNQTLYMGRRGGATLPLTGRIFQVIIRGALTADLTLGNRYVGSKMGITL